jgi:hypothetical protein
LSREGSRARKFEFFFFSFGLSYFDWVQKDQKVQY